jgi:hypothetical protein
MNRQLELSYQITIVYANCLLMLNAYNNSFHFPSEYFITHHHKLHPTILSCYSFAVVLSLHPSIHPSTRSISQFIVACGVALTRASLVYHELEGLRIWKEHIRVASTLIIAPALSNSPQ